MDIVKEFANFGVMGLVAAILFIQIQKLQDRLLTIIETNTKAFIELKSAIEKCQFSNHHIRSIDQES